MVRGTQITLDIALRTQNFKLLYHYEYLMDFAHLWTASSPRQVLWTRVLSQGPVHLQKHFVLRYCSCEAKCKQYCQDIYLLKWHRNTAKNAQDTCSLGRKVPVVFVGLQVTYFMFVFWTVMLTFLLPSYIATLSQHQVFLEVSWALWEYTSPKYLSRTACCPKQEH